MRIKNKIFKSLLAQQKTLGIAESCTGGLLSHELTNLPGSSKILNASIICYSNESKITVLGIPSNLIKKCGAVSQSVAKAMAQRVRKLLKTHYGVGITGIAGPSGGSPQKPVGLVFIAVCSKEICVVNKFLFSGNRLSVKKQAAQKALELLWQVMNSNSYSASL